MSTFHGAVIELPAHSETDDNSPELFATEFAKFGKVCHVSREKDASGVEEQQ